ncbi:18185_t:CDS:2 [Gigaspora rosea]|nr:18185_t:CDS:2 [Gigaspora rosea]
MQAPVLQDSNYFETCLKIWQVSYIIPCGAEFKTMDENGSINIPKNAFKIDKYTSVETGNVKLIKSTRHIDQQLPLILVINVIGININDDRAYLENKDLPEEINFLSEDVNIRQRYRLMGVSFCDGNYYIADVRLKNVKNIGWYQYDGLEKTYHSRAMYIESSRPTHKNNYAMNYVIYVKI